MELINVLFSPKGRMGRGFFFLASLVTFWSFLPLADVISALIEGYSLFEILGGRVYDWGFFLLSLIFVYLAYCAIAKRFRDLNWPVIFGLGYFLLIICQLTMADKALSYMFSYSSPGPLFDHLVSIGLMQLIALTMLKASFFGFAFNAIIMLVLLLKRGREDVESDIWRIPDKSNI